MKKSAIFLCACLVAWVAVSGAAADGSGVSEIGVPQLALEEYRIPILSLLEEGEQLEDFSIVHQPSLGAVVEQGFWVLFDAYPDFELAGGDVFTYRIDKDRVGADTRMAFLSPSPFLIQETFEHGFEGSFDGWDVFPADSQIFSFVSGVVGDFSLQASLGAGVEDLRAQPDPLSNGTATNGSWGGGTVVIICPDDDPKGDLGPPPPSYLSPGDGEVVVYRAYGAVDEVLLSLRVRRLELAWQARLETSGRACAEGLCASDWIDMQAGEAEEVRIWTLGRVSEGLTFGIGDRSTSIPFEVGWHELGEHRLGVMDLLGLAGQLLVFDNFSATGYFDPFEQRVADGFENGTLADSWDDTSQATGLAIDTKGALSGDLGLLADLAAGIQFGAGMKLVEDSQPASSYGARIELDITELSLALHESVSVLAASSSLEREDEHLQLQLENEGSGTKLVAAAKDDDGVSHTTEPVLLSPGRHVVVLRWQAGTPGALLLWVDGSLATARTSFDNSGRQVRSVRYGAFDLEPFYGIGENDRYLKLDGIVAW